MKQLGSHTFFNWASRLGIQTVRWSKRQPVNQPASTTLVEHQAELARQDNAILIHANCCTHFCMVAVHDCMYSYYKHATQVTCVLLHNVYVHRLAHPLQQVLVCQLQVAERREQAEAEGRLQRKLMQVKIPFCLECFFLATFLMCLSKVKKQQNRNCSDICASTLTHVHEQ